jgi:hypothetical protein
MEAYSSVDPLWQKQMVQYLKTRYIIILIPGKLFVFKVQIIFNYFHSIQLWARIMKYHITKWDIILMILLYFQSLKKYGIKMTIVHSNSGCVSELNSIYLHIQSFYKFNTWFITFLTYWFTRFVINILIIMFGCLDRMNILLVNMYAMWQHFSKPIYVYVLTFFN